MERRHMIAGAPKVNLAVRIRGLSHEERYFDEQTFTTHVTRDFVVIRLRERVNIENEVHLLNMQTQMGGTYRVAWVNSHPEQGSHPVGLELIEPEGEIWGPDSIQEGSVDTTPTVMLECQRCSQRAIIPVPEAPDTFLHDGFTMARACDFCKATTGWTFVDGTPGAVKAHTAHFQVGRTPGATETASAKSSSRLTSGPFKEQRQKGRAPIRLAIKVIRNKYGLPIFDVCRTINVSRTGVYFTTEQKYEVGENLEIILPYDPDSLSIPFPARVVRQDQRPGTYLRQVAIQLTSGGSPKF